MSSRPVYPASPLQPSDVHSSLGFWQLWRFDKFDFHSLNFFPTNAPKGHLCYRAGQEDSLLLAHTGLLVVALPMLVLI